jgi:hypothetical protein
MTSERIKEIQLETAYPESRSVHLALLQVWNECEQELRKELHSKEDLQEAHQMGAIFAYGRKSATREERLEHFNNWIDNKL